MSVELAVKEKVVGLKQVRRALHQHTARRVYLACDADPRLIQPLRELCSQEGTEAVSYTHLTLPTSASV